MDALSAAAHEDEASGVGDGHVGKIFRTEDGRAVGVYVTRPSQRRGCPCSLFGWCRGVDGDLEDGVVLNLCGDIVRQADAFNDLAHLCFDLRVHTRRQRAGIAGECCVARQNIALAIRDEIGDRDDAVEPGVEFA